MNTMLALVLAGAAASAAQADDLVRLATMPPGAETTGLFLQGPDLFLNVRPDRTIAGASAKASVGVFANADFSGGAQPVPSDDAAKPAVASTLGNYQMLLQPGGKDAPGMIRTRSGDDLLRSSHPDFNGFLPTGAGEGLLFTSWNDRPGGVSRAQLIRAADGSWRASEVAMVDFGAVGGIWAPGSGTVSPWGTPLIAERLGFDDTAAWNDPDYENIEDVQRLAAYLGGGVYPNPYRYGHVVELTDPAGAVAPVRLMAMGRFSHGNAVVMPDERTVYLSDEGAGGVFFKFVADTAGDLTAGTLHAARLTQDAPPGSDAATTAFTIDWIALAHGSNDAIAGWVAQYDGFGLDNFVPGRSNYITRDEIAAWAKGEAGDDRVAFLESRRAAAVRGATAEFGAMGDLAISFPAADGSLPFPYLAMPEIAGAMADGAGRIDLAANPCGAIYQLALDADFDVARMVPLVAGHGFDGGNAANACPADSIANPARIAVRADGTLIFGENGRNHENNVLWLYRKGQHS